MNTDNNIANTVKNSMPLFTKVAIAANALLFGITGVFYLIGESRSNTIGIILLVAGFLNIIYLITSVKQKGILFAILNFIFALAALVVAIDFQLGKNQFAILWMIITLIYLILGFLILLRVKKTN
ncbi:MAG: hypothetical protein ACNA7V_02355 [Bacteroidales bacterium]